MSSKWISKASRKAIETRDNMTCCYCGKQCVKYTDRTNDTDYATLDHIVSQWEIAITCESDAEFRRKIKDIHNLVLVCNGCNSSKQNTSLFVWCARKLYDYATITAEIARRIALN
jgi:5-methylcytosine-specific restriction endonuclease McrA